MSVTLWLVALSALFAQTLRVHTIAHRSQIERTIRELSDSAVGAESRV